MSRKPKYSDELVKKIRAEYKPRVVTVPMLVKKYNVPYGTIKCWLSYESRSET